MKTIWIDAVEFDEYGGFILDTQFVREMGQPYLMANGLGECVSPACVKFSTEEIGVYRFFVRTKNWIMEYKPDGLVIEVDGVKSEHICSQMHINGWYFEIGADFKLDPGEHTLKIYDTTGWFGRFSCVIITNDFDFMPARQINALKKQRAEIKRIQTKILDKGYYDLIIVGAGVGGVVAAITAARYGLKTALLNDRPVLGGNGSKEANITLEGAASAHEGYHETGIIFEILNYRQSNKTTWSEAFEKYTHSEKNLDVYSNILVLDAKNKNNSISEIFAINILDLTELKFSADIFVDGTGDGWLGYYAGACYRIGREAQFQHNEDFAPKVADLNTMSGCIVGDTPRTDKIQGFIGYYAEETANSIEFKAPSWAFCLPEGDSLGRVPERYERGPWWLEMPNDYDDLNESEFVRDSMFRMVVGYFNWMKNSWSSREKVRNYKLLKIGTYIAKRESRRLIGDYILTENDFIEGKKFVDGVCYSGWNLDVHHPEGIFSGKDGAFALNKQIPITPIPFRSLYSKNVKNLMMVGRCTSVTHTALGSTRVMITGGTMGQAVATAAYLCKKYSILPKMVGKEHIDELQQLLLKDGMYIPGISNHDPKDLARNAKIFADSFTEDGNPYNVINGKMKKVDSKDYAWISQDAAPQSITLSFDSEKIVKQVRLTFDIPFEKYSYGYRTIPVPDELVTDFVVLLLTDNGWSEVAHIKNNIQRLVVVDFKPTCTKSVKIIANKTLNYPKVIIPEIRIY